MKYVFSWKIVKLIFSNVYASIFLVNKLSLKNTKTKSNNAGSFKNVNSGLIC